MFTGIVKNIGTVQKIAYQGALARLEIESDLDASQLQIGDSIAINGVCLTIVSFTTSTRPLLAFDVGPETLQMTTLGSLRPTQNVHVEMAMRLADRLGGHLVQGHTDGIGIVIAKEYEGSALRLRIACGQEIANLCIVKGSIAIDGISLTLNQVSESGFEVCLIPHTLEQTCLGSYQVGDRVNLENDLIGKYVEKLVKRTSSEAPITWQLLEQSGFLGRGIPN
jgi:riboflavin synthase